MSSFTQPISPARFAAALKDLPLSSLHNKAAELRNSVAHLEQSNADLAEWAGAGDPDCAQALAENRDVITRQQERIELLRAEVEGRGFKWEADVNGSGPAEEADAAAAAESERPVRGQGGSLTDDELARRLAAQMGEDEDEGMHL